MVKRQVEVLKAIIDKPELQLESTPEEELAIIDKACAVLFSDQGGHLAATKASQVLVPERNVRVISPMSKPDAKEGPTRASAEKGSFCTAGLGCSGALLQGKESHGDENNGAVVFVSAGASLSNATRGHIRGDSDAHCESDAQESEDGNVGRGHASHDSGPFSGGAAGRQMPGGGKRGSKEPAIVDGDRVGLPCMHETRKVLEAQQRQQGLEPEAAPVGMRVKRSVCLDDVVPSSVSLHQVPDDFGDSRHRVVTANGKRKRSSEKATDSSGASGQNSAPLKPHSKAVREAEGACGNDNGGAMKPTAAKQKCFQEEQRHLLQSQSHDPFCHFAQWAWSADASEYGWKDWHKYKVWFLERAHADMLAGEPELVDKSK
jgi:hypothetical protein